MRASSSMPRGGCAVRSCQSPTRPITVYRLRSYDSENSRSFPDGQRDRHHQGSDEEEETFIQAHHSQGRGQSRVKHCGNSSSRSLSSSNTRREHTRRIPVNEQPQCGTGPPLLVDSGRSQFCSPLHLTTMTTQCPVTVTAAAARTSSSMGPTAGRRHTQPGAKDRC